MSQTLNKTLSPFQQKQAEELSRLKAFAYFVRRLVFNVYGDERFTERRKEIYDALEKVMPSVYNRMYDDGMTGYSQDVLERCEASIKEREAYCQMLRIPCEKPPTRTLFLRAKEGFQLAKELGLLKRGDRSRE